MDPQTARQFDELSEDRKAAVRALHDAFPLSLVEGALSPGPKWFEDGGWKTLRGVLATNSFMRGWQREDDAILCQTAARFNHSCVPNCDVSWHEDTFDLHIYAATDIAVGEELSLNYMDLRQTTEARRDELQRSYGFTCQCPACVRGDAASDSRRARLGVLEDIILNCDEAELGLRMVSEVVSLCDEEGLHWNSFRSVVCFKGVSFACMLDDLPGAKVWAERALKYSTMSHGESHPMTMLIARHVKDPMNPEPGQDYFDAEDSKA